ncbi:kinase-like domain-containing protein, partial [Dimargaris cristalligena]
RINQYLVTRLLGQGSYGAVHLAIDTRDNTEYALKEFSKLRLKKLAHSQAPPGWGRGGGAGGPGPAPGRGPSRTPSALPNGPGQTPFDGPSDPLAPIKREIAIFKKLHHPNIIRLYEVLNDPAQDSLYMVYEMCSRGAVIDIGLHRPAEPYPETQCRHYFREALLGVEYLHHSGIVHRDIKPDNLLLNAEGVLKIVDFGVSEMFAKESDWVKKSVGSPAFMAPELCRADHGQVSGTKTDIWSLGATLYCLATGKLPFSGASVPDMYEAIISKTVEYPENLSADLVDLLTHLLDKNPDTRLTIPEIRNHRWITELDQAPLESIEENCRDSVTGATEQEINNAINTISGLATIMKAIHLFK